MGTLVPIPDSDDGRTLRDVIRQIPDSGVAARQLHEVSRWLGGSEASPDDIRTTLKSSIVASQRAVIDTFTKQLNQLIRHPPELGIILNFRSSGDAVPVTRYIAHSFNISWKVTVSGHRIQAFIEELRERVSQNEPGMPKIDFGLFASDIRAHEKVAWALCSSLFTIDSRYESRAFLFAFLADYKRP